MHRFERAGAFLGVLQQMLDERATAEKKYAASLSAWDLKWGNDKKATGFSDNTAQTSVMRGIVTEAGQTADVHATAAEQLSQLAKSVGLYREQIFFEGDVSVP